MTTKHHIIESGSNGFGMEYPTAADKDVLIIKHNAGFFSCSTIALQDIVIWHRHHIRMPDHVDRSFQYSHYKYEPLQNLIPFYFNEQDFDIPFIEWYEISHDNIELQFSDYTLLDFAAVKPFVDKFFTPSQHVLDLVKIYEEKYKIDYKNTCGVFYRGNDKAREMTIAPYSEFAKMANAKAYTHHADNGKECQFFVLPDETEFLEYLTASIHEQNMNRNRVYTLEECPHMSKKDSAIPFEMPTIERADYAARFLAAVIIMSKCKYIITHSGNCGMWSVLYRGNAENIYQWREGNWLNS